MLELILLILSLLCLTWSVEASVACLLFAVGVSAFRRRAVRDELETLRVSFGELNQSLHRALLQSNEKVEKLAREVSELRSARVSETAARMQVVPPDANSAERKPVEVALVEPVKAPQPPKPVEPPIAEPKAPKPATPLKTPEVTPHPTQVHATGPVLPPPPPPVMPPRPSASYSAPIPITPLRSIQAKPRKTLQEWATSVFAFEEILGKRWLSKIGITLFVLGVASFGVYELGSTPAGKVALLLVGGFGLLLGGIYLERSERYQILGRTGIGGGWAILFFTAYAVHHVQAMQVLASESADLLLMLGVAVAMALHTLRYRSQVVTGLAFLLAYSTVSLSHDTVYALAAGAALAIGLVVITVRMRWYELEIFGILSSYLNHFYWLHKILGPEGANHRIFPEFWASVSILLVYWAAYRVSYVVRRISTTSEENVSSIAAILNTLLLLTNMKFQSARPELAFYALLALGALEFAFGQIPITRRRRTAFALLSVLGTVLMVMAVPFKYSGNNVAILWFVGAEAFLIAGILTKEIVFRRLGLATGILVGLHVLAIDCYQLYQARLGADKPVITGGTLLLTCGVLFYLNAHLVRRRWRDLFATDFDQKLTMAHSYLGAVTVTFAAWALVVLDWTAVAWIAIVVVLAWLSRRLQTQELAIQCSAIAGITMLRMFAINLHTDQMFGSTITHVVGRYATVPIVALGIYFAAAWIASEDWTKMARHLLAAAGTVLLVFLIWGEVPYRWQSVALIGLAVVITEAALLLRYSAAVWHTHLVTAIAGVSAVSYEWPDQHGWHGLNLETFVLSLLAGATYWLAWRVKGATGALAAVTRDAYTWLGSFLVAWLLWRQLPEAWVAVAWMAFGIVLALVGRRWKLAALCFQEHILVLSAVMALFFYNYPMVVARGLNLRLLTVALVCAGLYGVSRFCALKDAEYAKFAAFTHTWAATALLTLLAWYEAPTTWLVVVWAMFALALAAVGRQFQLEEFPWQTHVLAGLTVMRALGVNLYATTKFHGVSERLISLSIVILALYGLTRLVPMREELRRRDFHHAYTWVASFLTAMLLWYELQPVSVAVAWALASLLLFELGLLRDIRQLRLQAYSGLIASFVRIFFVNLAASPQGSELFGTRMTTVVPLVLIYFFVYAQMRVTEKDEESRWSIDVILAYVGSLTVASLLYFQVPGPWIGTAWAVLVFVLFAVTVLFDREVFLHQALLLTIATFFRGVMHNLYGASYFTEGNWTGRYLELGSAVLVMLAALPFAFQLRGHYKPELERGRFRRVLARLASRPEQVMFFVPVLLLTIMLALKMRAGMVTVAWGIEGMLVMVLALAAKERSFRLSGLFLLLLCVGKILVTDAWQLAPRDRYLTFIVLGLALLGVSFLYSKYREAIRQFL
jgi:hypothetical protein